MRALFGLVTSKDLFQYPHLYKLVHSDSCVFQLKSFIFIPVSYIICNILCLQEALSVINKATEELAINVADTQVDFLESQQQQDLLEEQEMYAEIRENHRQKEKSIKRWNTYIARTSNYSMLKVQLHSPSWSNATPYTPKNLHDAQEETVLYLKGVWERFPRWLLGQDYKVVSAVCINFIKLLLYKLELLENEFDWSRVVSKVIVWQKEAIILN